jgi:hypothetical protein
MTRLTKIVKDCTTGEEFIIELTDEEIAQREADSIRWEAEEAERLAAAETLATLKTSAKAKLVAGTPLTAEEAATIVL